MTGVGNPADLGRWLDSARLAADLVIVASTVSIARVLYWQGRRSANPAAPPPPRVLRLFAALLALCGVSHLAVVLADEAPAAVVPTALKLTAAALWVTAAVMCRRLSARLAGGPPPWAAPRPPGPLACFDDPRPPGPPPTPAEERALVDLAWRTERLKIKTRMLENMILNETWLHDKSDSLTELRDILADLEAHPC